MSEPLDTMKVVVKETGQELIINATDYDPDKHDPIVEDEPKADGEEPVEV